MLVLRHFVVFLPVIFTEFLIAVFHRVGSFNQVIAKESVAGTNAFGVFGLKRAGLMLCAMSDLHIWPRRLDR